jgi:hypothetical protein
MKEEKLVSWNQRNGRREGEKETMKER